jgi:two-component system chemotaxis response regulator CheB
MAYRQYTILAIVEDNSKYTGLCAALGRDENYSISSVGVNTDKADELLSQKKYDAVILMATNIPSPLRTWVRLAAEKRNYPIVVVTMSGLTESDFSTESKFIRFCNIEQKDADQSIIREINIKVRMVYNNAIAAMTSAGAMHVAEVSSTSARENPAPGAAHISRKKLIAVGASMGGVEAVTKVLTQLPAEMPGIVVTQHMPGGFTGMYAKTLDNSCKLKVFQAEDKMPVNPGCIYIAPGGFHMKVAKQGDGGYVIRITNEDKVSGHKPSVNVLFDSVAEAAGKNAMGVILTGMGDDGATGLLKMRQAGAYTVGQSPETCVVYGMPKVAYEMGAVSEQVPLTRIYQKMLDYTKR